MDLQLCTACVLADAGYSDNEIGWLTPEDPSPLNRVAGLWLNITTDDPHFDWSPCDGCGQQLGGDRYDATAEER